MTFLKKLSYVALATAIFACSCIPSAAVELKEEGESSSVDVTAKYSAGKVTDVYSVDIEWGSMEFEYTDESRVWNPETHKYETSGNSAWSCEDGADEVKITNHSNKPVEVELSYTPSVDYSEISGSFNIASKTLDAAEENSAQESAPSFTSKLALTGKLAENVTERAVIGTAKVTLKSDSTAGGDETPKADSYVEFTSNMTEYAEYLYETTLTYLGNNKYTAELYDEDALGEDDKPAVKICINETQYYIQGADAGYALTTENPVTISTTPFDNKRKVIAIEKNKRYRLTITLNDDGKTGTATLEEIGS